MTAANACPSRPGGPLANSPRREPWDLCKRVATAQRPGEGGNVAQTAAVAVCGFSFGNQKAADPGTGGPRYSLLAPGLR